MYNRYLSDMGSEQPEQTINFEEHNSSFNGNADNGKTFEQDGLLSSLTKRMGKIKLDTDTLILIAIIWFIIQENGEAEIDTELLVVLGILIFMGL